MLAVSSLAVVRVLAMSNLGVALVTFLGLGYKAYPTAIRLLAMLMGLLAVSNLGVWLLAASNLTVVRLLAMSDLGVAPVTLLGLGYKAYSR